VVSFVLALSAAASSDWMVIHRHLESGSPGKPVPQRPWLLCMGLFSSFLRHPSPPSQQMAISFAECRHFPAMPAGAISGLIIRTDCPASAPMRKIWRTECAFRRSRPLIPADRDHLFRFDRDQCGAERDGAAGCML